MPKKKKSVVLPPLADASHSTSAGVPHGFGTRDGDGQLTGRWKKSGTQFWENPGIMSQSESSIPLDITGVDARNISQLLENSLHVGSGFGSAPDSNADSWDIQGPDDIIKDVMRHVELRKPWRPKLDDSILDKKHNDAQDRMEHGFHIILPDNRVRLMEDELSYRTRASLLDMEVQDAPPPTPPMRPKQSDVKSKKMKANPWYLKPATWYTLKDNAAAEENLSDFAYKKMYADVMVNFQDAGDPGIDEPPHKM